MDLPVTDERYEKIVLQALYAERERVHTGSYEERDIGLENIRYMLPSMLKSKPLLTTTLKACTFETTPLPPNKLSHNKPK